MTQAESPTPRSCALVIGAGSRIAVALIRQLLNDTAVDVVVAVSRGRHAELPEDAAGRLQCVQSDYSESSIKQVVAELAARATPLHRVFICNGVLHNEALFPEKKLDEFTPEAFQQLMHINALIPALWLKHLKPLLLKSQPLGPPLHSKQGCVITVFSARVGSIDDNALGGWYSYRASKAALNMLLKNAAIEYSRFNKETQFLVFHPGTTDTPLSKPFHKSVPSGKLFSPEFVATCLLSIVNKLEPGPAIQYLDWDGKVIAW